MDVLGWKQMWADLAYRQRLRDRVRRQPEDQAWEHRESEYRTAFRLAQARLAREGVLLVGKP